MSVIEVDTSNRKTMRETQCHTCTCLPHESNKCTVVLTHRIIGYPSLHSPIDPGHIPGGCMLVVGNWRYFRCERTAQLQYEYLHSVGGGRLVLVLHAAPIRDGSASSDSQNESSSTCINAPWASLYQVLQSYARTFVHSHFLCCIIRIVCCFFVHFVQYYTSTYFHWPNIPPPRNETV